ncbi:MAG: flagellar basal body-associated FliL family protein [Xanthomonadaceae bacterium]|nr:flagellar basal body-associated FliL family protein [Xanthomonadaceae bacterium]
MSDKPAEAPKAPEAEVAPSSGDGNKMVMILTLVNLVVTMVIAGIVFISFKKDNTQPRSTDILAEEEHGSSEGEKAAGGHGAPATSGHGGGGGHGEEKSASSKKSGKIVTLEQFTVNLATSGSITPKYARVNISIEVGSDDVDSEISQKLPQVRNTVIDLFNSKRPSDLGSVDGRNYLKDEIRNSINSFLVSGKIKNVFFTNFSISG